MSTPLFPFDWEAQGNQKASLKSLKLVKKN